MDKGMRMSLFNGVMEKAKEINEILKNGGKINFLNKKTKSKPFYRSEASLSNDYDPMYNERVKEFYKK